LVKTYGDNLSVLNIVEGIYETTFNMTFIVTYLNVWTTTSNGYPYTATNSLDILIQIENYWNKNKTSVPRNIAHLFTGKTIVDTPRGTVYNHEITNHIVPITPNLAYSVSALKPEMEIFITACIGTHFHFQYSSSSLPTNCKCRTPSASVMCHLDGNLNFWFCQESINIINSELIRKRHMLTSTESYPNNISLTGYVSGYNLYRVNQKISSNQVINSGYTIYKAAEVELGPNFEIKLGADFEIMIDNGCP
jgi:hypothetical protein